MKKLSTLLVALFIAAFSVLNAQELVNDGMKLIINKPSDLGKQFTTISATFGGKLELDKPVTGKVVPTQSKASTDPIVTTQACDSVINPAAIKGNIALISRGTCNFVLKCLNAQKAGAIAVVVFSNAAGAAPIPMGGSDPAITIPCCMVSREDGIKILDAIKAGKEVNLSLLMPSRTITGAYGNWQIQTPESQKDTVYPRLSLQNQGKDTVKNISTTCVITDPAGKVTKLDRTGLTVPPTGPDFVEIFTMGNYYPPVNGKYKMRFYTSYAPNDTLANEFEISKHTFANDNGTNTGGWAISPVTFGTPVKENGYGKVVNILGYYATGATKGKATFASFVLNNAAALKGGRNIDVALYKADEVALENIANTTTNIGELGTLVGDITSYTVATTEKANTPIFAKLTTENKPGVDLDANAIYIMTLQYDGATYADGTTIKDSIAPVFGLGRASTIRYPNASVYGTAIMTGLSYFDYYSETESVICRMHVDGFLAAYGVGAKDLTALEANEVTIAPNPTSSFLNVKLDLNQAAKDVQIGIMDMTGRVIEVIKVGATQKDNVQVDVSNYAPGTYLLTVRTEKNFSPLKFVKN